MSPRKRADETGAESFGGKLPGKTEFSGRRRTATRTSGHHSHPEATGGDFRAERVPAYPVAAGEVVELVFTTPSYPEADRSFVAFGGWFTADVDVTVDVRSDTRLRYTQTLAQLPDWGKIGSMWPSTGAPLEVTVSIRATKAGHVAFRGMACGLVEHEFLATADPKLLPNMFATSPEAHFYVQQGEVRIWRAGGAPLGSPVGEVRLPLKQCNRCARFLPINIANERLSLSFSNHCVARRPCKHTGFGKLRDVDTGETIQLEYGYQLECRFCKKFTVNAAHNKQRTAAQMKEDAARRRYFEVLLTALYGQSSQLGYRHVNAGEELTDLVWERFGRRCFNCGQDLPTAKAMQLDHTRPLALLWPLDGTATALCGTCNSKKRDRPPAEFYTEPGKLEALAAATGIPLEELEDPSPNCEAVVLLRERLDWFFDVFLRSPALAKERDGKTATELLVKALQKAIDRCPDEWFDLAGELEQRRD